MCNNTQRSYLVRYQFIQELGEALIETSNNNTDTNTNALEINDFHNSYL